MGGKEGTREVCGEKVTDTASAQTLKLFFQELKKFFVAIQFPGKWTKHRRQL